MVGSNSLAEQVDVIFRDLCGDQSKKLKLAYI
jgi:hypothetical protein